MNKIFIGKYSSIKISMDEDFKHLFCAGTTGSGKTVLLSNFIDHACKNDLPCLIVDGKGDTGNGSILEVTKKMAIENNKKLYVINMINPKESDYYNPFTGNSTAIKDMIINLTDWTEQHYKSNTERFIQRLLKMMELSRIDISFSSIVEYCTGDKFLELSSNLLENKKISISEHEKNISIQESSSEIAESANARFATILESEIGQIFNPIGVDIYRAIEDNAIILFILNPLIYPELTPIMGRLVLIDCKKAVNELFTKKKRRTFFIFDEINTYISDVIVNLINKSRSADVSCILATQSMADLDYKAGEAFKHLIIENCNNYIVLRQNSPKSAEEWSKIIGTEETAEITHQINANSGSVKYIKQFIYHPDDIKRFKVGEGIYLSKDSDDIYEMKFNKPF